MSWEHLLAGKREGKQLRDWRYQTTQGLERPPGGGSHWGDSPDGISYGAGKLAEGSMAGPSFLVSQSSSHHLPSPLPVVFPTCIPLHHPLPSPISTAVPLFPAGSPHAPPQQGGRLRARWEGAGCAAAPRSVRRSVRVRAEAMGTASERRCWGSEEHRKS